MQTALMSLRNIKADHFALRHAESEEYSLSLERRVQRKITSFKVDLSYN